MPGYPFASVEHPIGSRSLDEIKARALDAYEQGVKFLIAG